MIENRARSLFCAALVTAAVSASATGCSGSSSSSNAGSDDSAKAAVRSALARMDTQQGVVMKRTESGADPKDPPVLISGTARFAPDFAVDLRHTGKPGDPHDSTMELIADGHKVYLNLPRGGDPLVTAMWSGAPAKAKWLTMPDQRSNIYALMFGDADPRPMLKTVLDGPVTKIGAETVAGVPVSHYQGTATDPSLAKTATPPSTPKTAAAPIKADLYVDAAGDIVESKYSQDGDAIDTVFTNWGPAAKIDIPKTDATFPFDPKTAFHVGA